MEGSLANKLIPKEVISKPTIFNLATAGDQETVQKLFEGGNIQTVSDDYEEQLRELFAINNPSQVYQPDFAAKMATHFEELKATMPLSEQGKWVYYPWLSTLVHVLEDNDFQKVRTARNKNLINEEEQKKFYNAVIGIGGLSVGNSVALAIVLQGGENIFALRILITWHFRISIVSVPVSKTLVYEKWK